MSVDAGEYRRVMGLRAAGVTVVTTRGGDGRVWGLTATAVCAVSLEPPLLLVCIDRGADCHSAFLLECRMVARYPGGDHTIFVGQVIACGAALGEDAGSPLLYFRGGYTGVGNRLPANVSSPPPG